MNHPRHRRDEVCNTHLLGKGREGGEENDRREEGNLKNFFLFWSRQNRAYQSGCVYPDSRPSCLRWARAGLVEADAKVIHPGHAPVLDFRLPGMARLPLVQLMVPDGNIGPPPPKNHTKVVWRIWKNWIGRSCHRHSKFLLDKGRNIRIDLPKREKKKRERERERKRPDSPSLMPVK